MNAGTLRDLVTFQKKVITYVGEIRTTAWEEDFQDWTDAERSSETIARFIIRYRRTATGSEISAATHRILWDGAIWNITSSLHDRNRSMLTIDCDFSEAIEVTHMQSEVREYIDGLPVIRTRE